MMTGRSVTQRISMRAQGRTSRWPSILGRGSQSGRIFLGARLPPEAASDRRPFPFQVPWRVGHRFYPHTPGGGSTVNSGALAPLPLDFSPEVEHALINRKPIIALETAIITHGLPYPTSLSLPLELERAARQDGVVPAHVALLDGRIKVGLSSANLISLADPNRPIRAQKLGRRDLAASISQKLSGGTTVSATMAIAHLVGIRIFATGGIGGVHRGAQNTMDISSDLTELARSPVAVVCAGAKSILDIGLTLEYLETAGVPVVTLGESTDFPAFYTPISGHQAPFNLKSAAECAKMIYTSDLLQHQTGTLVGVPIPPEFAHDGRQIQQAVEQALFESVELGMDRKGKEVTPWLLNRVKELSAGRSVQANIGLIKNNVSVAAEIALRYNELAGHSIELKPKTVTYDHGANQTKSSVKASSSQMLVIGAAAMDITSMLAPGSSVRSNSKSTVPGHVRFSMGGVALNVAYASYKLGIEDVLLVSQIGHKCILGNLLRKELEAVGLRSDGCIDSENCKTGVVNMFLDEKGELSGGVADLDGVECIEGATLSRLIESKSPRVVCLDANLSPNAIVQVLRTCRSTQVITAFEPTSTAKCTRILPALVELLDSPDRQVALSLMFPNVLELDAISRSLPDIAAPNVPSSREWCQRLQGSFVDGQMYTQLESRLPSWVTSGVLYSAMRLLPFVQALVVKNGRDGLLVIGTSEGLLNRNTPGWLVSDDVMFVKAFPAPRLTSSACEKVSETASMNVTGAGDTLCGAILASILNGNKIDSLKDWDDMIHLAQRAALETLKSSKSVGDLRNLRREMRDKYGQAPLPTRSE